MTDIPSFLSLHGKTAVVSGAASGIGLATVRLLHQMEADVVLLDKSSAKIQEESRKLDQKQKRAISITCDVTDEHSCRKAVEEIMAEFGHIDILVNNAGMIIRKDMVSMTEAEWSQVIDVNLKGVFLLSKSVLPFMIEKKKGSIIHISSGWGCKGGEKAAAYCAAKAGILNLSRAMAIDYGPFGIRINCVCPGDTDTPLLESEADQLGQTKEEFKKQASKRPLARIGKPEDIARAVLFFASPMSSWVTGSSLTVDGGGLA